MFGKESESEDKSKSSLDTSLSNTLGVSRSSSHDSNYFRGGIPSLTINDDISVSKVLTGKQFSTEKSFCNCSTVRYQ